MKMTFLALLLSACAVSAADPAPTATSVTTSNLICAPWCDPDDPFGYEDITRGMASNWGNSHYSQYQREIECGTEDPQNGGNAIAWCDSTYFNSTSGIVAQSSCQIGYTAGGRIVYQQCE